jgi:putative serine protease PepD
VGGGGGERNAKAPKSTVTRGGAWAIALVTALVVAGLSVGGTYLVVDRGAGEKPAPTTEPAADPSGDQDLNSGKNTPSIPPDAYDGQSPQWSVVAAAVQPTVVAIQVTAGAFGGAQGSGVIINSEKGYVVTNNHVVAQGDAIQIVLADGRLLGATVRGTDPTTDLAVLEISDPPKDLKEAELGDSDSVVVGEPVMAVGNPLGYDNTVTTGIVSALNRPVTTEAAGASGSSDPVVTNAIQVDAAVNPGNSGGPLFNAKGQVIGINSSIATAGSSLGGEAGNIGLAFAIPVNLVANVAGQLIDNGVATHPLLGVTAQDATAEVDGVRRAGAELVSVANGKAAEQVGLKAGDIIIAVDGHPITGSTSLTAWIRSYKPGDKIVLTVMKGSKSEDVEVTLTNRDES